MERIFFLHSPSGRVIKYAYMMELDVVPGMGGWEICHSECVPVKPIKFTLNDFISQTHFPPINFA